MGDKLGTEVAERSNNLPVMLDPKFLKCHICTNPLHIPVYQCSGSHFVCSKCSLHNGITCTCSCKLTRCPWLSAIIQSTTVCCSYSTLGCRKKILYSDKLVHENSCPFSPNCFCPILDCDFKCIPDLLSSHFKSQHSEYCINAQYGVEFSCIVPKQFRLQVVIGEDGRSFLLLNEYKGSGLGTYVTLVCMGLESVAEDLCYEISAALDTDSEGVVWSMKSSQMISIRKWTPDICTKSRSLFILPSVVYGEMEEILLNFHISKK